MFACSDSEDRLYFYTCNTYRDDSQDYFACSNLKSNTGSCFSHYIREQPLREQVLRCVQSTQTYVRLFREDFKLDQMVDMNRFFALAEKYAISRS